MLAAQHKSRDTIGIAKGSFAVFQVMRYGAFVSCRTMNEEKNNMNN